MLDEILIKPPFLSWHNRKPSTFRLEMEIPPAFPVPIEIGSWQVFPGLPSTTSGCTHGLWLLLRGEHMNEEHVPFQNPRGSGMVFVIFGAHSMLKIRIWNGLSSKSTSPLNFSHLWSSLARL